jgi:Ca-activated chloride channel family protein
LWERAVKNYESALALDPKDEDAKFNRDFVKKKIEELKKQQEQQQNQNNQGNKNQDQKNQEQQKNEQQQKQDQQPNQQQSNPEPSEPKQQQEQQPQQAQAGNLDKQQAKALLDNLREDERNWNFFLEVQMKDLKDAPGPVKDW